MVFQGSGLEGAVRLVDDSMCLRASSGSEAHLNAMRLNSPRCPFPIYREAGVQGGLGIRDSQLPGTQ